MIAFLFKNTSHCRSFSLIYILTGSFAWAQEASGDKPKSAVNIFDQPGRLFDMKIPKGFKPVAAEEAGTLRWRKGDGEIQLVVGELQYESANRLFEALHKAAKSNNRIEKVRTLRLKQGIGLTIKEKPPKDPDRLRIWRLMAAFGKKIFNVEFSAPGKEFDSFAGDFKAAIKSFKLASQSKDGVSKQPVRVKSKYRPCRSWWMPWAGSDWRYIYSAPGPAQGR
jgi:hypothetical protein